jgi:NifB/MoaA-like Fe-S oxidoreductase
MSGLVASFLAEYGARDITVVRIANRFFGESVTVAGLVTGGDILEQAGEALSGREVILPRSMLKEFEDIFLDGVTLPELEKKLAADVRVCGVTGYEFFDALCG